MEEYDDVSILHIFGVTQLDGGKINCTACLFPEESSGDLIKTKKVSCTTELKVLRKDELFSKEQMAEEPAMITNGPKDCTALVGNSIQLTATFVGTPQPRITWNKAVSVRYYLRKTCN